MESIKRACEAVGGVTRMAERLGVSAPTVHQWCRGIRPVPVERCAAIELISSGAVTRRDLRPDDWAQIWPELASAPVSAIQQGA